MNNFVKIIKGNLIGRCHIDKQEDTYNTTTLQPTTTSGPTTTIAGTTTDGSTTPHATTVAPTTTIAPTTTPYPYTNYVQFQDIPGVSFVAWNKITAPASKRIAIAGIDIWYDNDDGATIGYEVEVDSVLSFDSEFKETIADTYYFPVDHTTPRPAVEDLALATATHQFSVDTTIYARMRISSVPAGITNNSSAWVDLGSTVVLNNAPLGTTTDAPTTTVEPTTTVAPTTTIAPTTTPLPTTTPHATTMAPTTTGVPTTTSYNYSNIVAIINTGALSFTAWNKVTAPASKAIIVAEIDISYDNNDSGTVYFEAEADSDPAFGGASKETLSDSLYFPADETIPRDSVVTSLFTNTHHFSAGTTIYGRLRITGVPGGMTNESSSWISLGSFVVVNTPPY